MGTDIETLGSSNAQENSPTVGASQQLTPPDGYEFAHADGTVYRAENAERAIAACPVLGKMATDQASLLLEIAALGQQKLREQQTESQPDSSNNVSSTNSETKANPNHESKVKVHNQKPIKVLSRSQENNTKNILSPKPIADQNHSVYEPNQEYASRHVEDESNRHIQVTTENIFSAQAEVRQKDSDDQPVVSSNTETDDQEQIIPPPVDILQEQTRFNRPQYTEFATTTRSTHTATEEITADYRPKIEVEDQYPGMDAEELIEPPYPETIKIEPENIGSREEELDTNDIAKIQNVVSPTHTSAVESAAYAINYNDPVPVDIKSYDGGITPTYSVIETSSSDNSTFQVEPEFIYPADEPNEILVLEQKIEEPSVSTKETGELSETITSKYDILEQKIIMIAKSSIEKSEEYAALTEKLKEKLNDLEEAMQTMDEYEDDEDIQNNEEVMSILLDIIALVGYDQPEEELKKYLAERDVNHLINTIQEARSNQAKDILHERMTGSKLQNSSLSINDMLNLMAKFTIKICTQQPANAL